MPFRQYQEKELDSPLPLELPDRFFLYQGAVNEGRAFDQLIPAMIQVPIPLLVVGNGNYFHQLKELVAHHSLQQKVILVGSLTPDQLKKITPKAFAGITLFNNSGLNQYYSLANRFFDYVQAGIPQLCNAYPEYKVLNRQFEVALLVEELTTETIVQQMNKLLSNNVLYQELKQNAIVAANEWCWENESKILLMAWNKVLTPESK
jgi:glycosyltransferase involved in cell wall biosynthesis